LANEPDPVAISRTHGVWCGGAELVYGIGGCLLGLAGLFSGSSMSFLNSF
jgi:hypothetical protein